MEDTPAHIAGLTVGDVIEAVDSLSTENMSIEDLGGKIKGPENTKVTLTIIHPGQDTSEDITVTRDRIVNPTITEYEKRLAAYKANKPWWQ